MQESAILMNREQIGSFCRKHHIVSLALFGSILTSHFGPKSDVDVLVSFDAEHVPNLFDLVDMESELSVIVGRRVDLKTPNDLAHISAITFYRAQRQFMVDKDLARLQHMLDSTNAILSLAIPAEN